jgi:hypothetical protein
VIKSELTPSQHIGQMRLSRERSHWRRFSKRHTIGEAGEEDGPPAPDTPLDEPIVSPYTQEASRFQFGAPGVQNLTQQLGAWQNQSEPSKTSPSRPRKVSEALEVWKESGCAAYVSSLSFVPSGFTGSPLRRFLRDALAGAVLPAPWALVVDDQRRVYFANASTRECSWSHPHENCLKELASMFNVASHLSEEQRQEWLKMLLKTWQDEAKSEYSMWYAVPDDQGREYFCHRVTSQTMWEHPSIAVLPYHHMRIEALGWLGSSDYLQQLGKGGPSPVQTQTIGRGTGTRRVKGAVVAARAPRATEAAS